MRILNNPISHFWTLARLAVVMGATTGLLYSQASDFDWTEAYSIIELGVVLLAFEAGVLIGRHRRVELINWVRLFVALSGMAILLFLNATSFDSTEAWVLVGVPAVIAVFEGLRTWMLASAPATQAVRRKPGPAHGAAGESSLKPAFAILTEAAKRAYDAYGELPKFAKGVVVSVVTLVAGTLFGFSAGEVLRKLPVDEKPHVQFESTPSDFLATLRTQSMEERLAFAKQLVEVIPGYRLHQLTGEREETPPEVPSP